jgi:hypothetical protein
MAIKDGLSYLQPAANYVWNTSLLSWEEMEQPILNAGSVVVSGTVNQGTGGASAWLITANSLPLPSGASTESTLALIKAKTDNLDVALSTRTKPSDTQFVSSKVALTASAPTAATVGVSSGIALASNLNRKSLVLTNTSNNMIYLGLGAAAVVDSGIIIAPFSVWNMNEYSYTTAAIYAIASGAGSNLAIQEFT